MTTTDRFHVDFMRLALEEAKKCEPTPTAFCVGCLIVQNGQVLSAGYSRDLPGNTHAEQCALEKLLSASAGSLPRGLDMYTTMEPCSERLSGIKPCTDRILDYGNEIFKSVYLGVKEPSDFVECEGVRKLKDVGIQVVHVQGLEEECLEVARKGQ